MTLPIQIPTKRYTNREVIHLLGMSRPRPITGETDIAVFRNKVRGCENHDEEFPENFSKWLEFAVYIQLTLDEWLTEYKEYIGWKKPLPLPI